MKKVMNKINFALISLMVAMPAVFAVKDAPAYDARGMCDLVGKLQGVFRTLRALAFIGAAFYIAAWAWDYIKGGEAKGDDIKKKSIALLVGFGLLLMVGAILSFVMSSAGMKFMNCPALVTPNW